MSVFGVIVCINTINAVNDFSNSIKLIHQRLDKLGANVIDKNENLRENVKHTDELKQKSSDVSRY